MYNINYLNNAITVNFKKNEVKVNNVQNQINVNLIKKNVEVRNKKNEIKVNVIGRIWYNNIPVNYITTPPANRNAPGQIGQLASDDDSMYFCFKPNQWAFWRLIKGW